MRYEHEGFSFYTITLTNFGKTFEECLDVGCVAPRTFQGFQGRKAKGLDMAELPNFLGVFLELVFDRGSGKLLDDANVDAIRSIRQLTLFFGKILLECSDARKEKAVQEYIKCEQELEQLQLPGLEIDFLQFDRIAELLFGELFSQLDQEVWERESVRPKHGPGSTADNLLGNKKFDQRTWTCRLQEFFPWEEFLATNSSFVEELEPDIEFLEPGEERPVKVTLVPKTLKTPRVIAQEPTVMQYIQQGLMRLFVERIGESNHLNHFLGFDDQTPNQRMACEGSLTGELATLDLSEASDRVLNQIVERLFSKYPYLNGAIQACRSTHADAFGEVVNLTKFASMGSALTFPIEAMVFLVMVFIGIENGSSRPLCRKDLKRFFRRVRIYGDDIIVPVVSVLPVIDSLETIGLVVNRRKSFWTGKFRESCGKEYYNGEDISIVRARRLLPSSPADAAEAISLVSLRNQLYFSGYWATCKWLDGEIREVLRYFPVVLPSSSALGRHSFLGYTFEKLSRKTHAPMVKAWRPRAKSPKNSLSGHGALAKCLAKTSDLPFADAEHLERSGRPRVVNIKLGFCSPF